MVLEIAMINSDNNNNGEVKDMSKSALRISRALECDQKKKVSAALSLPVV